MQAIKAVQGAGRTIPLQSRPDMAKRTARPGTRRLPKTLTGILASIALAVLAALGVKTDWFHGKPSAPPTERPPAARGSAAFTGRSDAMNLASASHRSGRGAVA